MFILTGWILTFWHDSFAWLALGLLEPRLLAPVVVEFLTWRCEVRRVRRELGELVEQRRLEAAEATSGSGGVWLRDAADELAALLEKHNG